MADREFGGVLDQLLPIWGKAMKEKRFHDALTIAYAHYLVARELKDPDPLLGGMQAAIEGLLPADETPNKTECSFCGRAPPEVRLASGPRVFICEVCVKMLSENVFAAPA